MKALVAFDGSADALRAIDIACVILERADAMVLHVRGVPPADDGSLAQVRRGRALDEVLRERDAQVAAASHAIADHGAERVRAAGWLAQGSSAFTHGGTWDEILRVAEELSVDAVVLGARGLTGVRAALGSVSDAVVHNARQPVLVVPPGEGPEPGTIDQAPVLVAFDGSDGARAALAAATELLSARELLICHVGDENRQDRAIEEAIEEAIAQATAAGFQSREVPAPGLGAAPGLSGRAWRALVAAAREHEAAAVVVGSRGRAAAREIVLGSVAMGVLHHAERPVIVAPPTMKTGRTAEGR